jgi:hypothetical protein
MGQGPFYRVARIGRQPGRGGFACRAGGRCGVSQGKLVLVAAEALCLDIAGRYRSVLKIGAFDWALYLKALTAGTTEGGWDLPVSESAPGERTPKRESSRWRVWPQSSSPGTARGSVRRPRGVPTGTERIGLIKSRSEKAGKP